MKYLLLIAVLFSALTNAEETKSTKHFMIKTKITQGEDLLSAPTVVTQVNNEAIIQIVTEKYLPESWEIDIETMHPMPIFDYPTDFGVTQKVTIKEVEKNGQKITLLHGELILKKLEETPKLTEEKSESSKKDYLFFQTEKKANFAFDITSRKKVSYTFKEGQKTYKVDMEVNDVIREKPKK